MITMAVYNNVCPHCGWSSGPSGMVKACPRCGGVGIRNTVLSNEGSSGDPATGKGCILIAAVLAAVIVVLFPGAMITMLIDAMTEIRPGWGSFFCCLGFSGVVFLFTGFDIKKYLIITAVVAGLCTILAWCISSFCPWKFALEHIFFGVAK